MKSLSGILFFIAVIILAVSCKKEEDEQIQALYSQNDTKKMVIQTVTTNLGTGFNDLFATFYPDSLTRANFCHDFTHQAIFMDDGSGYVFIESFNGYNIAHPAHPEREGTYTMDQTDAYGKKIVEEMIDIARYIGFGFLEYDYENPVSGRIEKKTTFVKSIPVADWYAGSGYYHGVDQPFLTEMEMNKEIVKQAVHSMAEGLGAVFENYVSDSLQGVEIMRTLLKHIRFFDDLSGYFYVIDFSGYNVVQPPDPSLQGTYEWDIQDSQGNYLVRGLVETARNGGGFYSYYWIDYQTNQEKLKTAYVEQIPGKDYLIGSGIYSTE